MDDGGGFDHWDGDDDDFGTFTGADDSTMSTPGKSSGFDTMGAGTDGDTSFTSWSQSGTAEDLQGNIPSTTDSGISDFANFGNFEGTSVSDEPETANFDTVNRPKTIDTDTHDDDEPVTDERVTIKHSLTDSGLYSSDVSPVLQSDLSGPDAKSHSDSDSIEDLQLDPGSTEKISSDKISINSENISVENDNDLSANEQDFSGKDNHGVMNTECINSSENLTEINQNNCKVDLSHYSGSSDEEVKPDAADDVQSFEATGNKDMVSENIPQVQNSSHSIEDNIRLHTNVSAESNNIDTATNNNVIIEEDNVNEFHDDKESSNSDSAEKEELESQVSGGQADPDLHVEGTCQSKLVPTASKESFNSDSKVDVDKDSNSLSRSADSIKADTKVVSDTEVNDSGQSQENQETLDNVGSCNSDKENFKGSQKDLDLNSSTDNTSEPDAVETHLEKDSSDLGGVSDSLGTKDKIVDDITLESNESEQTLSATDNASLNVCDDDREVTELNEEEFDDFSEFKSENVDEKQFGEFTDSDSQIKSDSVMASKADEFGAFSETENGFANFGAENSVEAAPSAEQSDNWAAFSEPQISESVTAEVDDDEWASFGGEDDQTASKEDDSKSASFQSQQPAFQNMSKHDKVLVAVTGCFSSALTVSDTGLEHKEEDVLEMNSEDSESPIWSNMRGLKTTNALAYHWSQSQWNSHLYHTLKVDTRNILFGHKKSSSMPIFASGLTMLEPTKGPVGSSTRSHDTLIDTSKPDDSQVYTQVKSQPRKHKNDTIAPAQFDWSSSGLTNPLEAANKTLNLDFLIQESEQTSGKSHALESEFLGIEESTSHKPATIQPLENILANLKSSSTFKPTNQNEDLSQEASRIIQSLPNLAFMKMKVLMFPLKLNE